MMEFSIDYAKKHGKGGILLTTSKVNFKAQALYKKFGYEMLGLDTHLDEYLMILRFKGPGVRDQGSDRDVSHQSSVVSLSKSYLLYKVEEQNGT